MKHTWLAWGDEMPWRLCLVWFERVTQNQSTSRWRFTWTFPLKFWRRTSHPGGSCWKTICWLENTKRNWHFQPRALDLRVDCFSGNCYFSGISPILPTSSSRSSGKSYISPCTFAHRSLSHLEKTPRPWPYAYPWMSMPPPPLAGQMLQMQAQASRPGPMQRPQSNIFTPPGADGGWEVGGWIMVPRNEELIDVPDQWGSHTVFSGCELWICCIYTHMQWS